MSQTRRRRVLFVRLKFRSVRSIKDVRRCDLPVLFANPLRALLHRIKNEFELKSNSSTVAGESFTRLVETSGNFFII